MLSQVTDAMRARGVFASIDIHNNTGLNPHYACVNALDYDFFHLALLFSRTVVYFKRPLGVQSAAFAELCPAITLECGRSGAVEGTTHAAQALEACLNLTHFPEHPVAAHDIDLMRTFAIVRVPDGATLSFDGAPADLRFAADVDRLNFSEVEPGQIFGHRDGGSQAKLEVVSAGDAHVTDRVLEDCFAYDGEVVRFAQPVIPSMLTRDVAAIGLDCLCYLMYRIDMNGEPLNGWPPLAKPV